MLNLIKYEMRKTRFSKLIILIVSMILELFYMIGIFMKRENIYLTSISILLGLAFFGIIYIGIESLIILQKDLNTKQSYMLFMTPNNSYKILGSKIIENGISILLYGLFFSLLALIDAVIAVTYIGGLDQLVKTFQDFLDMTVNIRIDPWQIFVAFMVTLVSWMATIVFGDFAIVLSATFLAGKKFSGIVSFLIFMVIMQGYSFIIHLLPDMSFVNGKVMIVTGTTIVCAVVVYLITGWIMDKKLSV